MERRYSFWQLRSVFYVKILNCRSHCHFLHVCNHLPSNNKAVGGKRLSEEEGKDYEIKILGNMIKVGKNISFMELNTPLSCQTLMMIVLITIFRLIAMIIMNGQLNYRLWY